MRCRDFAAVYGGAIGLADKIPTVRLVTFRKYLLTVSHDLRNGIGSAGRPYSQTGV